MVFTVKQKIRFFIILFEIFISIAFIKKTKVDFLKPFIINDFDESTKNNQNKNNDTENNEETNKQIETWLNGPASYWYNLFNYESLIETKKKELRQKLRKQKSKLNKSKKNNNNSEDEDEENVNNENTNQENHDPYESLHYTSRTTKRENSSFANEEISLSQLQNDDCQTIDLTKAVSKLKNLIIEETFLPINTTNWEDQIIIDLNQVQQLQQQQQLLINERVKFAGWIPSSEHRTLISFQTKVLGKKLDKINQYKDYNQSSATGGHSLGRHASNLKEQNVQKPINWNSIFPSTNHDLFESNWEDKIIFDPQVNLKLIHLKN